MPTAANVSRPARICIIGISLFVASAIWIHLVQPDLSILDDAVSYYMNGPFGWVLGGGLVAMGLGSFGLWAALRRKVRSRTGQWVVEQGFLRIGTDSRKCCDGGIPGLTGSGSAGFEGARERRRPAGNAASAAGNGAGHGRPAVLCYAGWLTAAAFHVRRM